MKKKVIKVGDVEFKVLFPDLLPEKSPEEYQGLSNSIRIRGVQVPIILDESNGVIDGKYRLMCAAEHKMKSIPFIIVHGKSKAEKKHLAIMLNAQRRHMTRKERLELVRELSEDTSDDRYIAELLSISQKDVQKHLRSLGKISQKFTESTGKKRAPKIKKVKNSRTFAKRVNEAKRVSEACKTIRPTDLPNSMMNVKRVERVAREKQKAILRTQECTDFRLGQAELLSGEFQNKGHEIDDNSISLIFTDPPYDKKSLPLWNDLGIFAARVLRPGGLLVSYSGSLYLPQIYEMLGRHLKYLWTAAIQHTGGKKLVPSVRMHQAWKPILVYYKPPLNKHWKPISDMVSGGKSKKNHAWEQSVDEAVHYIEAFCPKSGTLLDPMLGSGTTVIAGLKCGIKRCIGIEVDPVAHKTAEERIKQVIEKLKNDVA